MYKGTNFIKSNIDSGRVGGEVVVFKRWFGFESASLGPSISTSEVWWYSMGILIYLYIYKYFGPPIQVPVKMGKHLKPIQNKSNAPFFKVRWPIPS